MTTSAELVTQVGVAVNELKKAKDLFEGIREETEQRFGEIDQELNAAVDMVSGLTRTYYVHNETGDDSNNGSSGNPFATSRKAFSSVPIGGVVTIYILAGQMHLHDSISVVNGSVITIRPWSWSGHDSDKPVIKFQSKQNDQYNYLDAISLVNGAKILCHSLVFDHEDKKDSSLPWSNLGSMFYTSDSVGMAPVLCLYACEATLHSGGYLFLSAISAGTFLSQKSNYKGSGTLFSSNTVGMAGFLACSMESGINLHSGTVYSNLES